MSDTSGNAILPTSRVLEVPEHADSATATNQNTTAANQNATATNQQTAWTEGMSFPALPAPGALVWHAPIAAGAPVDVSSGFNFFFPARGFRVTMGALAVACNVTVDAELTNGAPVTVVVAVTGVGTFEVGVGESLYAYRRITRVRTNVDPGDTVSLEINRVFAIPTWSAELASILDTSTDGVITGGGNYVTGDGVNPVLGTVSPLAAPNGTRNYYVRWTRDHGHAQDPHTHTQNPHTHTQNPHTHSLS